MADEIVIVVTANYVPNASGAGTFDTFVPLFYNTSPRDTTWNYGSGDYNLYNYTNPSDPKAIVIAAQVEALGASLDRVLAKLQAMDPN